jgi:hypothetical protein
MERGLIIQHYRRKFLHDYEKAVKGLTPEEQVYITEQLEKILTCFQKKKVNYDKVKTLNEELLQKYGKRLAKYSGVALVDYFHKGSLKFIDLQNKLKLKDAGEQESHLTEEEYAYFLKRTKILLGVLKAERYLKSEPRKEDNNGTIGGTGKTKVLVERKPNDLLQSKLNQEQSVLLIHFLRKSRTIRDEDYLKDNAAGDGFSTLTGFSAISLRLGLGKKELKRIKTKTNLKELEKAITNMSLLIANDIRDIK